MVRGVGIDSASISATARMIDALGDDYVNHVFGPAELAARESPDAEYLTGRFAVKEAAFKALAHLTPERTFDMRVIETVDAEDGHPEIVPTEGLLEVMGRAGVTSLFVSITTEGDVATAIVVAE